MARVKESDLELPAIAIEYLRNQGMTYEDIASKADCNRSTIWRAHTQGSLPMKHTARKLKTLALKVFRQKRK